MCKLGILAIKTEIPVTILLALLMAFPTSVGYGRESSLPRPSTKARTQFFPDTTDGIHLEMVFNYNVNKPDVEQGKVDMVWGSSFATQPAGVYNTSYIPYSVDNFSNSVAWYQRNHPDWLEYQCDKKTLAFQFGGATRAPLDFANPEVRAYQWANWVDAPLARGYHGIAVDNMGLTNAWQRCGHFDRSGHWVQQYTGRTEDSVFRHDVLGWEAATYEHIHNYSKTATMQVNVSYQFSEPQADSLQLMTTTDLLFDERGFTNNGAPGQNVPSPKNWKEIVDAFKYVESKGVCYTMNGEEPEPTNEIGQKERLWVLSNYLLLKERCTYVSITGITKGSQNYGSLVIFPEYSIPIGRALGPMAKADGVWERMFTGGLALVNPSDTTATVALPVGNSYNDLNGNPAGPTVTLSPQTGEILLVR